MTHVDQTNAQLLKDARAECHALRQRVAELEAALQYEQSQNAQISELKAVQVNFNALLNNSSDYILISDGEGKPVVFNTAYADIVKEAMGFDMKPGIIPHQRFKDDNLREWWDNLHQRVLSGESFRVEFSYPFPDGRVRHSEFSYHPIEVDGTITGFSEICRDITERKQMEQELRKSEQRFRTLVFTLPHGIQESNKEGIITFSNPAHHQIQGYDEGELIGKYIWDFVATDADKRALKDYYQFLMTQQPIPTPYQAKDKTQDGRIIDTQIHWDYLRDADGEVIGLCSIISDITERKRMEDALRESEANLTAAQHIAHIGNWVHYLERDELHWSDEMFQIFGRERQQFTRQELLSWIHPDDQERLKTAVQRYREEKSRLNIEYRIIRPDGEIRTLHTHGEVVCNDDGDVIKTLGTVFDFTKHKQLEEALRESESNLKEAQRIGKIGNWVNYLDRGELYYSDELFNILGRPRQKLTNKDYPSWIHPEDSDRFREAIQTYQREKTPLDIEIRIIRPDGEARHLHVHGEVICNAEGEVIKTVGTTLDITERKQMEEALRESEINLKEAQRIGRIGNWVHYLDRGELLWSDELFHIFGRHLEKLTPEENYQWLHPDDRARVREAIARYVNEKDSLDITYRIIRSDGELRTVHSYGEALCDDSGNVVKTVGTLQDITVQLELENKRVALAGEQKRSEILRRFIANATHEFRTPLSLINLNTHILRQLIPDNTGQAQLELIEMLVKQITRLVNDLVLMAKLDSDIPIEKTRLDMNRMILQMDADMQYAINPKGVNVTIDSTLPQPLHLQGNMALLYRTFRNILENAVQHTEEDGAIHIIARADDNEMIVSIADTGCGMTTQVAARIFERFYRIDQAHTTSGFGLGLPIAQRVVHLHDGEITVESQPGKGSTFTIRLPLS